jgi:hypothetical protein
MNEAQSIAGADASIYMAITGRAPLLTPTKPATRAWTELPRKCQQFVPRIRQQATSVASLLLLRMARKSV